ncbi:MAG: Crp/Fnr family transcriptional regulator [Chloroflexi bacterium]|nr:Crp/Fnr family transcriptional regulator [Chloroflexota bacterium]MDA1147923.1 Crp/Fnr family transcriptional regulator [Chloroflexota bacterium]
MVLASLPLDLLEELLLHASVLSLKTGDVVERQGGAKRVFFPLSGMLTGVRTREDGSQYAYLHRGRESAVNAIGLARAEATVAGGDLVVDIPGVALTLEVDYYRQVLERSPALTRTLLTHASYVVSWREQAADCSGHHTVRARTACLLLMLTAHQSVDSIQVTHARIADVLGARRQWITEVLGGLQVAEVITLERGRITVLDRNALWHEACDCRSNVDSVLGLQLAGRFEVTG